MSIISAWIFPLVLNQFYLAILFFNIVMLHKAMYLFSLLYFPRQKVGKGKTGSQAVILLSLCEHLLVDSPKYNFFFLEGVPKSNVGYSEFIPILVQCYL